MNRHYRADRTRNQRMLRNLQRRIETLTSRTPSQTTRKVDHYSTDLTTAAPEVKQSGHSSSLGANMKIIKLSAEEAAPLLISRLAQKSAAAADLLMRVRQSYPSQTGFVQWCLWATEAGLTGDRLVAKHLELGRGAELIIHVLERQVAKCKNPVCHARAILSFAEIRNTVAW